MFAWDRRQHTRHCTQDDICESTSFCFVTYSEPPNSPIENHVGFVTGHCHSQIAHLSCSIRNRFVVIYPTVGFLQCIWLWIDNSHLKKHYVGVGVGVWQMEELIRSRLDHIDVPSLASNRNTVTMCPTGHMAVIQCNAESFVRICSIICDWD